VSLFFRARARKQVCIAVSATLLMILPIGVADATEVLIDKVHGKSWESDQLAAALPRCAVTFLTDALFPIETMLATGVMTEGYPLVHTFDVPAGVEAIYGRFEFSGMYIGNVSIQGPGDPSPVDCFQLSFHRDDPEPGTYQILTYFELGTLSYEIGSGPYLLSSENLELYDVYCCIWDETGFLFSGHMPEYTPREESVLNDYMTAGGGLLYLREPPLEFVLKPIVNLYLPEGQICELDIAFPGYIAYANPLCDVTAIPGGSVFNWSGIKSDDGEPARIEYEGQFTRKSTWLEVDATGAIPQVINRMDFPLHDLVLIHRGEGEDWRFLEYGHLAPHETLSNAGDSVLDDLGLKQVIGETMHDGGVGAGLFDQEMQSFQERYRWAERWLQDAEDGGWCALYHIDGETYDALIPSRTIPETAESARVLWIWTTGIPGSPSGEPLPQPLDAGLPQWMETGNEAPIVLHEYGVSYHHYPASAVVAQDKSLDWLGWSFYDEAFLEDSYFCDPQTGLPWLHTPGGHPEATILLSGVETLAGANVGVIDAPWEERMLVGSEWSCTTDGVFCDYPGVAVAKSVGLGRAMAIADIHCASGDFDWGLYLSNAVAWLGGAVADLPDRPIGQSITLELTGPNPFNPSTTIAYSSSAPGLANLSVYDISGRLVKTLVDDRIGAGQKTAEWNGKDLTGKRVASGTYFLRLKTDQGVRTTKVMLAK
jgi:flagellar hook capping protein FlgD